MATTGRAEAGASSNELHGTLGVYLNDHLAGSAAGLRVARRLRDRRPGRELAALLEDLIGEIEEDRGTLERAMERVGATPNTVKQAAAAPAAMAVAVKNRVPVLGTGSAELSAMEDLELLSVGIEGKRLLWLALGSLGDERLSEFDFAALARRAEAQRDRLEPQRLALAARALAPAG